MEPKKPKPRSLLVSKDAVARINESADALEALAASNAPAEEYEAAQDAHRRLVCDLVEEEVRYGGDAWVHSEMGHVAVGTDDLRFYLTYNDAFESTVLVYGRDRKPNTDACRHIGKVEGSSIRIYGDDRGVLNQLPMEPCEVAVELSGTFDLYERYATLVVVERH